MSGTTMSGRRKSAKRAMGIAAALAGALLLASCGSLITPTAPQLYTLTPRQAVDPSTPRVNWQLLVEAPVAAAGIDTPRIAVTRTPTSIDYFADVSWADRAPLMVQGLIVRSLEDSGKIVSVGRDTVGLRSDFLLKSELRDFQAEHSNPASASPDRVHVRLSAKLVAMPRRTIEAGETFEATVPVQGGSFAGVVAAFNEALGRVTSDLVSWTLRVGAAVDRSEASGRPRS